MRPSMLETGLEVVAYNLNRKNSQLRLFEFGKTYSSSGTGLYAEQQHLCLYVTGAVAGGGWKSRPVPSDFFYLKGMVEKILQGLGLGTVSFDFGSGTAATGRALLQQETLAVFGAADKKSLDRFDIKQPVWFADFNWDVITALHKKQTITFRDIPRFPAVQRDLALVVDRAVVYEQVQRATESARIKRLQSVKLFDVFENEKLGAGKKSMAVSFTFLDEEKTMTDKDIDAMMTKIMVACEKELGAEIRKS
jgi:phenylalanyl-tRNA synthetase beta chain